jgi:hypothetical protein
MKKQPEDKLVLQPGKIDDFSKLQPIQLLAKGTGCPHLQDAQGQ